MDDLISRQAAIDEILKRTNCTTVRELYEYTQEHHLTEVWSGGVNEAIDAVIEVPSAQPELIEKGAYVRGFEQGRTQGMLDTRLSSAQPEIIHCKDCSWSDNGDCMHHFGLIVANDENFCSYGERREE